MAYIPKGTKWYLASQIEQITVEGEAEKVVHKNMVLIHASSPEEAYKEACEIGIQAEARYKNPQGKYVTIKFKGLNDLKAIYEKLEHGAELAYEEFVGLPEQQINNLIRRKEELSVFSEIVPTKGPDYSSAEILAEASKAIKSRLT